MSSNATQGVETQQISEAQWDAMLANPVIAVPHFGLDRRCESRASHRAIVRLFVGVGGLRKPKERFLVRSRDLSQRGLGFVHSTGIAPGTRCRLAMLTRDDQLIEMGAAVVNCVRRDDGLFNVGLHFDRSIVPRDFVEQARRD